MHTGIASGSKNSPLEYLERLALLPECASAAAAAAQAADAPTHLDQPLAHSGQHKRQLGVEPSAAASDSLAAKRLCGGSNHLVPSQRHSHGSLLLNESPPSSSSSSSSTSSTSSSSGGGGGGSAPLPHHLDAAEAEAEAECRDG